MNSYILKMIEEDKEYLARKEQLEEELSYLLPSKNTEFLLDLRDQLKIATLVEIANERKMSSHLLLQKIIQALSKSPKDIRLFYINGKLNPDLYLPPDFARDLVYLQKETFHDQLVHYGMPRVLFKKINTLTLEKYQHIDKKEKFLTNIAKLYNEYEDIIGIHIDKLKSYEPKIKEEKWRGARFFDIANVNSDDEQKPSKQRHLDNYKPM